MKFMKRENERMRALRRGKEREGKGEENERVEEKTD